MNLKSIIILSFFFNSIIANARDELKAGVFNIIPYGYLENGKITGITSEIIDELESSINSKISKHIFPYKRMVTSLESGQIDFAIFFYSDYSASISERIIPLYSLDTIAIAKKDISLKNVSDLTKYKLVTPRGVRYNAGLIKDRQLNIRLVDDYSNAIKMLLRGRVDVIIAPEKILYHQLKNLGLTKNIFGDKITIKKNTAWIQFSNKSEKVMFKERLREAGILLKNKGIIEKIIRKYYSK